MDGFSPRLNSRTSRNVFAVLVLILLIAGCNVTVSPEESNPKSYKELDKEANQAAELAAQVGQDRFKQIQEIDDYCALMPVADVERIIGKKITKTDRNYGCKFSIENKLGSQTYDFMAVSLTPESGTIEMAKKALKDSEATINNQTKQSTGIAMNIKFEFEPVAGLSEDAVFMTGFAKVLKWSNLKHSGHFSLIAPEGTHIDLAKLINENLK